VQASSYTPIDRAQLLKLVRATQGAMEHERRRTRRVTIPSKVRLKFGKEELEGETIDVSMSGLLVRAPRTAPVSSSLGICLQLSNRMRPIAVVGSVARILNGNQMGIQLDQLSLSDSEALQEFLLPLIPTE
jgi:hypothetical protein